MPDYIKKSYGFELCWASTSKYSAHMIVIMENEKTPYMYHKIMDQTIFVLQGTLMISVEGKNKTLNEGDKYHIAPKIMHRLTALKGDVTILEVGTKIEDDIIIVEK